MKERIKELRSALGMTQSEFAEEIGLTKNYISLLENGQRSLGEQSIRVLCSNHHVNEEWLKTGIGDMFEETTVADEIAAFAANTCKLPPSDPRYRIMMMLANLPQEDWKAVADMLDLLKDQDKKETAAE